MEVKATRTITCKGKTYPLCEPTFDVYAKAMQKYISGTGSVDQIGAGQILFDACYIGEDLDKIQKDIPLYTNLCLRASNIIEFFEGEIKKN